MSSILSEGQARAKTPMNPLRPTTHGSPDRKRANTTPSKPWTGPDLTSRTPTKPQMFFDHSATPPKTNGNIEAAPKDLATSTHAESTATSPTPKRQLTKPAPFESPRKRIKEMVYPGKVKPSQLPPLPPVPKERGKATVIAPGDPCLSWLTNTSPESVKSKPLGTVPVAASPQKMLEKEPAGDTSLVEGEKTNGHGPPRSEEPSNPAKGPSEPEEIPAKASFRSKRTKAQTKGRKNGSAQANRPRKGLSSASIVICRAMDRKLQKIKKQIAVIMARKKKDDEAIESLVEEEQRIKKAMMALDAE